jgi:type VI protein secretion system component VasA
MDKKIAGLLGAVAAVSTMTGAQAATQPASTSGALQASSYADLLAPVPNAVAALNADNAARAQVPPVEGVKLARYHHHHHHHHHRRVIVIKRHRYHHHHHHHHHSGAIIGVPGVAVQVR